MRNALIVVAAGALPAAAQAAPAGMRDCQVQDVTGTWSLAKIESAQAGVQDFYRLNPNEVMRFGVGGSFIYVPPGVQLDQPLQAYFRINSENMGQFERTLIIVDEGAYVHYVEGCSAPVYTTDSLHAAVVNYRRALKRQSTVADRQ